MLRSAACGIAAGLSIVALFTEALPAQAPSPAAPAPTAGSISSTFRVFLRSAPIGTEQVDVERTADGWTITSSGSMGPPVDVVTRQVQVRYTADWKPLSLSIDGTLKGQPLIDRTTVSGTTVETVFTEAGQTGQSTATIAADAVLLPSPFWGPFEALAQRVKNAAPGTTISSYNLQGSVNIQVGVSTAEAIDVGNRGVRGRRTAIKLNVGTAAPLDAEIWSDDDGHLLRLSIPAQNLEVVREDIASVAARRVVVSHPGDETIRIPANGFTLTGTLSKPAGASPMVLPAVVLVGGSGPSDRDETVFGIPIFGQLAGTIADAGFLVVRYDKRGVGQSGGRAEAATLADYSEDLRAVVRFVANRKDVDRRRIAVVGHSEGGSVAMIAAAKENRIAAVVLLAALGVTGAQLNLDQVGHTLDRAGAPAAERQAKIDLQQRIQQAVISGKGWEGIPENLKRQADIPWFQSFLNFDPAKPMSDMDQPVLIVQGSLDKQVAPANADRLEALAKARKKGGPAEVARVAGVNHLLVLAVTGEIDEYASLPDKQISSEVSNAVTSWLRKTLVK